MLFDLDETLLTRRATQIGRLVALLYAVIARQEARKGNASAALPQLTSWYERLRTGVVLAPGAAETLDALQRAGVRLGIVTNGAPRKRHIVALLGLEDRASTVVISDEGRGRKPDPAPFQQAIRDLGLPPQAILFVGDKRDQDIRGAHDVGMRTAWRRHWPRRPFSGRSGEPDLTITDLPELLAPLGADQGAEPTTTETPAPLNDRRAAP